MAQRIFDAFDKHDQDAGVRNQRRAYAIEQFNEDVPDWPGTPNNNALLFGYLEKLKVPVTRRNLTIAADELAEMNMLEAVTTSEPRLAIEQPKQQQDLPPSMSTVKLTYKAEATPENIEQHFEDLALRRKWAGPIGSDPRKSEALMTDVRRTRAEHSAGKNYPARYREARAIVGTLYPDINPNSQEFAQLVQASLRGLNSQD